MIKKSFYLLFISFLLMSINVLANDNKTVETTGEYTIYVKPDKATFNITFREEGTDLDLVKDNFNNRTNHMVSYLTEKYDILHNNINSTYKDFYSYLDYYNFEEPVNIYAISETYTINVNDLNYLDEIYNEISEFEISYASEVSFSIDNIEEVYDKALIEAINVAIKKGEVIINSINNTSNYEIENIEEVTNFYSLYDYKIAYNVSNEAASGKIDIEKNDVSIEATVKVLLKY